MSKENKKRMVLIMAAGIFIICGIALADGDRRVSIVRAVSNEVEGEISAISKNYIAVVYNQDTEKGIEHEMSFFIDNSVTLEHLKSVSQISVGDRVRITFDEETVQEEGKEHNRRKPKKLSFVRPAVKKPAVSEEVNAEEEDEEMLPIKRLKSE